MTIDEVQENLSAYMDGELDETRRRAVEEALAAQPELRAELAALRRTVELVGSLPRQSAPPGFAARVAAAIGAEAKGRPAARPGWLRPVAAAAAACLVVGLVALLLAHRDGARPAAVKAPGGPAEEEIARSRSGTHKRALQEAALEAERMAKGAKPRADAAGDAMEGKTAAEAPERQEGDVDRFASRTRVAPRRVPSKKPVGPPRATTMPSQAAPAKVQPPGIPPIQEARPPSPKPQAAEQKQLGQDAEEPQQRASGRAELLAAIQRQARKPKSEMARDATAGMGEARAAIANTHVVEREYGSLLQCLAEVRSALESANVSYVVQPVGSGRFIVEATMPRGNATALLGRLAVAAEHAKAAGRKKIPAGAPRGPVVRLQWKAKGRRRALDDAKTIHLVLRFQRRGGRAAPEARQAEQDAAPAAEE